VLRRLAWICVIAACGSTAPAPVPPVEPARRDPPATAADLAILQRADEILASPAVWNRHDTRDCPEDARTWSLYCALERATIEVAGAREHRGVALQEVRFAIDDAMRGVELHHRLMDYNNLATTRFEDIKRVIAVALERVRARIER
jgi:hypothetical protein